MRNRIILAAVEETRLRGFKFTMSDLAKRLSISKSSLYEHFSSKDNLIGTVLDIVLDDFRTQAEKIYNSDLSITEKLKAALTIKPQTFEPFPNRVYEDLRLTYPEYWEKVVAFRKERMDCLTALLKQGMDAGCIRNVNTAVVQQMLVSTMNELVSYQFLAENNITYLDAVTAMVDVIINGLVVKER